MELRETFDTVAELYATARPSYPDEIVDALPVGDDVLEVGCGAGQLTKQLVARGRRVTCIELGANLAAGARREVPEARVVNANFETWEVEGVYDVVTAGTAWDWIGAIKYDKARAALRPGGHLAIIGGTHTYPADADPFFRDIQEVYDEINGAKVQVWPTPETTDLQALADEIRATGRFDDVRVRSCVQELHYTPEEYIRVLRTFSNHILMTDAQQEALFAGVRRLAPPVIRKHLLISLHVATRVD